MKSPHTQEDRRYYPVLPSIESQTVAFVLAARAVREIRPSYAALLEWQGFEAYLRYHACWQWGSLVSVGEVVTIARVDVPEAFQKRGWFMRYVQLCHALSAGGVVIESVFNSHLLNALRRRDFMVEFEPHCFFLPRSVASGVIVDPSPLCIRTTLQARGLPGMKR
ncbi:hypothetical protein [Denitromonas ohlonensis]|uniref:Uncharacterized protein n=2 Tax=Denitromonas TaxID=139331 RepID=A0A557SF79_9RHOO|nr:hypothetical protein [Denitromonas ohlonensis]TVO64143.1 hypothetical protein FHP90_12615 [Denitromonas ohlonensis]TVO76044.1 hypothetical protein FHP89_11290 [Denitromonas ohlonensis]